MSRKTLLTEAEVRQFLKLANLKSVGDARIQEMGGPYLRDDDEEPVEMQEQEDEMEMDVAPEEGGEDMEMDVELGGEDEGAEDLDMDMDADAEGGAGTVDVQDFMDALESALEDVLGEPVSVDDEEDEEGLGDEDDLEMDAELGGEEDVADEEEPMMEDELVNEVAKRVADRLKTQQSQANMVDQLAERIMKRLTK